MLTVRPSVRADLAAIDALLARSYPALLKADYPPSVLVTALPIIARARPELVASGHYYVVVAEDGAIVGAGGWSTGAPGGGGGHPSIANIRHVVTDHRRTRQGIGRALMTRILGDARAAGARLADCLSTRTAVPFYEAMGFQTLGPCKVELRAGVSFPAIQMQRPL